MDISMYNPICIPELILINKSIIIKETQTIKDWAAELGVNKGTLFTRYYKGWSTKEILYGNEKSKKTVYLEYDGKKLSLKEWSKIVGYHSDTLRNRMKKDIQLRKYYLEKKENKQ